jgi:hypothetical protein
MLHDRNIMLASNSAEDRAASGGVSLHRDLRRPRAPRGRTQLESAVVTAPAASPSAGCQFRIIPMACVLLLRACVSFEKLPESVPWISTIMREVAPPDPWVGRDAFNGGTWHAIAAISGNASAKRPES